MSDKARGSSAQDKLPFKHSIYLADEQGNIYFARRTEGEDAPPSIEFKKVSNAVDRFDFSSVNEMHRENIFPQQPGQNDRSVAVVKKMLAMGVTAAAMPSGAIHNDPGMTMHATSYIINLASFSKTHAYWPEKGMKGHIQLESRQKSGKGQG